MVHHFFENGKTYLNHIYQPHGLSKKITPYIKTCASIKEEIRTTSSKSIRRITSDPIDSNGISNTNASNVPRNKHQVIYEQSKLKKTTPDDDLLALLSMVSVCLEHFV